MTLQRNTFEGLNVNDTPSTSNSGGASGSAFAIVSNPGTQAILVTDFPELDGGKAARFIGNSSGGTCLVGFAYAETKVVAAQEILYVEQKPSEAYNVLTLRHASGNNASVVHKPDGTLDFQASGASATGSGSPVLTDSVAYLIDVVATQAVTPTSSNGRYQAKITRLSDQAVIFSYDNATVNTGTTPFVATRFGKTNTVASVSLVLDNLGTDDGRTSFIDPLVTVVDAVMPVPTRGDTVIPFSWAAATGTVVVSQVSGPTATINRPTSTTAEVVLPPDQTEDIVIRFRATSGEDTDDQFATITPSAGVGPMWTVAYKNETGVWEPPLPGGLPA